MKVDFNQMFLAIDSSPLKDGDGTSITLKKIAIQVLAYTVFPDERELPGEKKAERFNLALKIQANDVLDLKAEEIAEIKKLIGKSQSYTPVIVGQAWAMLEGGAEK